MKDSAVSDVPVIVVPYAQLERFCHAALERMGLRPEDRAIWADVLLQSALRSVPGQGQGVQRLAEYYGRIRRGEVAVDADLEVVSTGPAVVLADAHNGIGAVMATCAMRLALERAATQGIGAVGVRHSTHFGIAAYYAMLALPHDCIGLAFSNAGPEIAPWGGIRATVGTNPWAVAVPAGHEWPVVLDMANSTSGKGMIGWYLREGRRIPWDWALTADGQRTDDPEEGMRGTLFPLGGAKGYAIAVVVDALTGVLTGSGFGLTPFANPRAQDVGHLFIAIDVARFMPVAAFKERMDSFIRQIRSSPQAPGAEAIYLPGELEYRREAERRRDGIPIEAGRFEALRALSEELGLEARL
jgi:LDH2 family malate/lactate/ureidoglycolate dehydrogenase